MKESLLQLDSIVLNFSEQSLFVLNLTIAFIMFGVALGIKVEHFRHVWDNKRYPVIGFLSQFVALPAITFIVIILFNRYITPTVAMGMILVASCPGGNISNFISALAKGHAALSVTLTAIATVSAIFLTPLNFFFWGSLYTKYISIIDSSELLRPLEIDPIEVFKTVLIVLAMPLLIGMLFNHFFPKLTEKIMKPLKALSILAFAGILIASFANNFEYFVAYIKYIFLLVLVHNAIALGTGYLVARATHCKDAVRRTITIETGIQNSALALVLLFNRNIFPADLQNGGMAFIAAWWGIWHILAGLSLAGIWSTIKPKESLVAA